MDGVLRERIMFEAKLLTDVDDSVGIPLANGKGLFIQIVDCGEGKEYLLELNDVADDGSWEPCAAFNGSSPYGDLTALASAAGEYLSCAVKV